MNFDTTLPPTTSMPHTAEDGANDFSIRYSWPTSVRQFLWRQHSDSSK